MPSSIYPDPPPTALTDHLVDAADSHDATAISFTPDGSISATDVQAAIVEVRDEASGSGIPASIVDVKGDLIVATAADTVARLAAGTDGDVLTADSGATEGVAWATPTGGGAPTTVDYLVGTADAGLSGEIVVGTTPGGELGNTWASPTVDATHSGSTHAAAQAAAEATAAGALTTHAAAADPHAVYLKESDFDDVDFLVGTATGHTAAEIVVGTSPGGELGGTWASPTVDATHAGTTHSAATDTHIADGSAAHAASAVAFTPNGSIAATDVQAAIQEVRDEAGGGGAPSTVDYLVGTADGGLSAEIVVGTTPGGELGGTWASPTVDATHSGSTHGAAVTTHEGLSDPHTGYRLESADHSHATTGAQGGTVAHSALTGLTTGDDHTQYQKESEKSAVSGYASLDAATKVPIAEIPTGTSSITVALGNHLGHSFDSRSVGIIASSDESKNSLASVADDAALAVGLTANLQYVLRMRVFFLTNATADLKYRLTFSGTTTRVRRFIQRTATTDTAVTTELKTAFDAADVVLSTTGLNPWLYEEVILQVGASGGTFRLRWSQGTSDAGPTTRLEGSYIEVASS